MDAFTTYILQRLSPCVSNRGLAHHPSQKFYPWSQREANFLPVPQPYHEDPNRINRSDSPREIPYPPAPRLQSPPQCKLLQQHPIPVPLAMPLPQSKLDASPPAFSSKIKPPPMPIMHHPPEFYNGTRKPPQISSKTLTVLLSSLPPTTTSAYVVSATASDCHLPGLDPPDTLGISGSVSTSAGFAGLVVEHSSCFFFFLPFADLKEILKLLQFHLQ